MIRFFNSCEYDSKYKYSFNLRRKINFNAIIDLIFNFSFLWNLEYKSRFEKIYIYLCALCYFRSIKIISKRIQFDYLVTFADMQPLDNILSQYANNNSLKTVTLQHGLYIDYKNYENINVVNYKNIVSKYFLAWGDDTNDLVKRYHSDIKIVVCGKPIKKKDIKIDNYFTVLFDQNIFHFYNKKLLALACELADKLDIGINLRLHPQNKLLWYKVNKRKNRY